MKDAAQIAMLFSSLLLVGSAGAREDALPVDAELECLILEGAEIAPSNWQYEPADEMAMQEQLRMANQGHVIKRGNSMIVVVREFRGRSGAPDGQRYRKLTARISGLTPEGGGVRVDESHFVSGSSAFVAWGLYYVSNNKLERMSITHRGSRRVLSVNQELPSFRVPDGVKEDVKVSFECELKTKDLDQLSAWQGSATAGGDPFYP